MSKRLLKKLSVTGIQSVIDGTISIFLNEPTGNLQNRHNPSTHEDSKIPELTNIIVTKIGSKIFENLRFNTEEEVLGNVDGAEKRLMEAMKQKANNPESKNVATMLKLRGFDYAE